MNPRVAPTILTVLASLAILGGCTATLDVGYSERAANRALLTSVAPRRVVIGPITDRRMDQTRIGTKAKNGKALGTTRPVADIVREALVVELTTNGHAVVADGGDIRVTADVEEFWLDTVGGNGGIQYVGRVGLALGVRDERGGAALLTRRYAGIKRRQAEADAKEVAREVMETALARTIRDIATDPDLVAALARRPAAVRVGDR